MSSINFIFLCIFLNCILYSNSKEILREGVTNEEKKLIVQVHNHLRSCMVTGCTKECSDYCKVRDKQPKARSMQKMIWDDKLAEVAQNWANKCLFSHDDHRDDSRFCVGQNIRLTTNSQRSGFNKADFNGTIYSWFGEIKDYNYSKYQKDEKKMIGHYTQIVWTDTYLVGCGFTFFEENNYFHRYYVCNYGPCGNIIGEYPYDRAGTENVNGMTYNETDGSSILEQTETEIPTSTDEETAKEIQTSTVELTRADFLTSTTESSTTDYITSISETTTTSTLTADLLKTDLPDQYINDPILAVLTEYNKLSKFQNNIK
ncbi:venom allergen 3-like [Lycorma delicatula]|uniref:venom allergen 3-like n=1 Tax=Lycorma delicatula TaxID=130591 RepID=UPI003F50D4DB